MHPREDFVPVDFPRIAKEMGFSFSVNGGKVDKRKLDVIDVDHLIKECDLHTLHDNLTNIVNYEVEVENDVKHFNRNLVKLFKLAQLAIDYLMYSQQHLLNSVHLIHEEYSSCSQDRDRLTHELKRKVEDVKLLKKKLKETRTRIKLDTYFSKPQYVTSDYGFAGVYYKCGECPKAFVSAGHLRSHCLRRHTPAPTAPSLSADTTAACSHDVKELPLAHDNQILKQFHLKGCKVAVGNGVQVTSVHPSIVSSQQTGFSSPLLVSSPLPLSSLPLPQTSLSVQTQSEQQLQHQNLPQQQNSQQQLLHQSEQDLSHQQKHLLCDHPEQQMLHGQVEQLLHQEKEPLLLQREKQLLLEQEERLFHQQREHLMHQLEEQFLPQQEEVFPQQEHQPILQNVQRQVSFQIKEKQPLLLHQQEQQKILQQQLEQQQQQLKGQLEQQQQELKKQLEYQKQMLLQQQEQLLQQLQLKTPKPTPRSHSTQTGEEPKLGLPCPIQKITEPPFEAVSLTPPATIATDLPPVTTKMLAAKPRTRFTSQTAVELPYNSDASEKAELLPDVHLHRTSDCAPSESEESETDDKTASSDASGPLLRTVQSAVPHSNIIQTPQKQVKSPSPAVVNSRTLPLLEVQTVRSDCSNNTSSSSSSQSSLCEHTQSDQEQKIEKKLKSPLSHQKPALRAQLAALAEDQLRRLGVGTGTRLTAASYAAAQHHLQQRRRILFKQSLDLLRCIKRKMKKSEELRTISLISHATRIIQRTMNRRIYTKMNIMASEEQLGFRHGMGTRDAIWLLRILAGRYMDKGMKKKRVILV